MNTQLSRRRKGPAAQRAYEGMIIRGSRDPSRRGMLGLLLTQTPNGALFGLTAAHLIEDGNPIYDDDGAPLGMGRRIHARSSITGDSEHRSTDEALGLIAIEPYLPMSPHSVPTAFNRSVDDPFNSLGQHVQRIRRDGSLATARLCGVEICCAFRSGVDGKVRRYHGALEIITGEGEEAFASFGDSGSVVYSQTGNILGIVIGGIGEKIFASPLHGLVGLGEFKVASAATILQHNERARGRSETAAAAAMTEKWPVVAEFAHTVLDEA